MIFSSWQGYSLKKCHEVIPLCKRHNTFIQIQVMNLERSHLHYTLHVLYVHKVVRWVFISESPHVSH